MTHEQYSSPLAGSAIKAGRGSVPPRALVYRRVSTDEQAEKGYSLPDQDEKAGRFCEAENLRPIGSIADDFTGRRLDRPGLNRVSELARAGAFDVLVCVRTDRLARKNHLRRTYEEWLEKRGIEVRYVEQRFDNTPSGRLQRGIQGEFDEHDAEKIRANTMMGRENKAKKSHAMPCYAPTYGYRQITVAEAGVLPQYAGQSGHLTVVEEEAILVRRMFELCASGKSVYGIALWLRDHGYRTRKSGQFTHGTIRKMLRSETYRGRLYFGRRECRKNEMPEEGEPQVFIRPKERAAWIELPCPAIVGQELFEQVQERLDQNRENGRGRPSSDWPLTGTLFCMDCKRLDGLPLRWSGAPRCQRSRTLRRYACGSHSRTDMPSCGGTFSAERLEEMALDALKRAADPDWLEALAKADAERRLKEAGGPARDGAELNQQLAKLSTREERIADLILAGTSPAVVEKKITEIREERERLTRALALAKMDAAAPDPVTAGKVARRAAEYLRDELSTATADPKRLKELFRLFLEIHLGKGREPEIAVRVPYLSENASNFLKCFPFSDEREKAGMVLTAMPFGASIAVK